MPTKRPTRPPAAPAAPRAPRTAKAAPAAKTATTATTKASTAKAATAKASTTKTAATKSTTAKTATATKSTTAKTAAARTAPAKATRTREPTAGREPAGAKPAARATRPSGQEPKASSGVAVGDRAPGFSLPADDGKTYSLAGLQGKRVVLYFYPRDSTPGCTTEACDFRDRQAAFTAAGAVVLGVSGDDLKSHARFRGKQGLTFPLLSDADNAVAAAYGAFGAKMMYGRSLQGIIRSTFVIGPDGTIEALWRPVRVPGHADAVLQTVTAARA